MPSNCARLIEEAWFKAQRYALLAENAERQDERVLFVKLCEVLGENG